MKLSDQRNDVLYIFVHHHEAPQDSMGATILFINGWLCAEARLHGIDIKFGGSICRYGFAINGVIPNSDDTKLFAAMTWMVEIFKAQSLDNFLNLGYLDINKLRVRNFFPIKPRVSIVDCFPKHLISKYLK